ncbi:MAG: hypothetical protein JSW14_01005 [Candidatus Bathyarchaeum sp.]|nr:MAG: hypothetical protein JSW14_01005 [Candidatus Bathyarchaeum sp.]
MTEEEIAIVKDIRHMIDNDEYAWMVCWGPPRKGKSTLCLLLAYHIYKDWNKVLDCIVFNLNQLLYKLQKGIPERWPTHNDLHMRVPLIIWDDFGAHSNKAKTQHERGWDTFKGAFDTLGTKLGVLIANMVSPSEPTQQLVDKYSHELWVYSRGRCKYDRVKQQQDFRSWHSRQSKEWLQDFKFGEIPLDVFKQYDEMRCGLADEVLFSINETMATTQVDKIAKRIAQIDIDILTLLTRRGPTYHKAIKNEFGKPSHDALIRLKARGLVVPRRESQSYYKYDITDLGFSVLDALENTSEG